MTGAPVAKKFLLFPVGVKREGSDFVHAGGMQPHFYKTLQVKKVFVLLARTERITVTRVGGNERMIEILSYFIRAKF